MLSLQSTPRHIEMSPVGILILILTAHLLMLSLEFVSFKMKNILKNEDKGNTKKSPIHYVFQRKQKFQVKIKQKSLYFLKMEEISKILFHLKIIIFCFNCLAIGLFDTFLPASLFIAFAAASTEIVFKHEMQ